MSLFTPIAILVLVIFFLSAALRILNEYERGVIFRLGRVIKAKGPGLIILIPIIDKIVKVSLRLVAMDVDPQDVITRDNVSNSTERGSLHGRRRVQQQFDQSTTDPGFNNRLNLFVGTVRQVRKCPTGIGKDFFVGTKNKLGQRG